MLEGGISSMWFLQIIKLVFEMNPAYPFGLSRVRTLIFSKKACKDELKKHMYLLNENHLF
jgi:hypothetical protein